MTSAWANGLFIGVIRIIVTGICHIVTTTSNCGCLARSNSCSVTSCRTEFPVGSNSTATYGTGRFVIFDNNGFDAMVFSTVDVDFFVVAW